ncbi:hypothetical protein BIV57_14390 [Mangrovactinospora gilvigrisea]|uniref:RidA family protein n=1 Tax=Mangrovactinospora gilvigrisea TaxID=1428644 RepID=A0A1J7C5H1_9ACTN|nr:Rid family hydrolase [Mangrovactinospora gilvigrisea]OIV36800.1 hypothetical protein BIV57_14390 [Mangrovactinospora gilvigrisea]
MRREGDRAFSGSPHEADFGSARAVQAGPLVLVSGCTALRDGLVVGEGDPYRQARRAIAAALEALAVFGLGKADVVRTRMFVTHTRDTEAVGRAHRDELGEVRPAATMVVVQGLVDSRTMVEIEVEALRRDPS